MFYHDLVAFLNSFRLHLFAYDSLLRFISSLFDSIHGGPGHEGMTSLDQQYQLFASAGAIKFPITPVTEAWKEKVCHLIERCHAENLNLYLMPKIFT